MAFDNSANFFYTGATQLWPKPLGLTSAYFIVNGSGGGGNAFSSSGGGGAYVFANFKYLQPDVSYNVAINVGSGGNPPPSQLGGITLGGYLDASGNSKSNGGNGTTLNGLQSGGGGGMTNIFYVDPSDNIPIQIIAGGGGGAGNDVNKTGGNGGQIGSIGIGLGGGQGGNTNLNGNAGLGGALGGVNGYNFIDSSGAYFFLGGGGGSGGTFAGGGGGAGYGGGAGGKQGGGGGGGSFTNANSIIYVSAGGGAGGGPGQKGANGSVTVLWNTQPPIIPPVIVPMFMLDPQHSNRSIISAAAILPNIIKKIATSTIETGTSLINPNSAVINSDNEIYMISGDGALYAYNHDLTFRWRYAISGYQFIGTPIIISNDTLYLSSTTSLATPYFYAITDNTTAAGFKWRVQLDGNASGSPILDLSNGLIYVGTTKGTIYCLTDGVIQGFTNWIYSAGNGYPIIGTPALDISLNRLCYTTNNSVITTPTSASSLYLIDLDISQNLVPPDTIIPNQKWQKTLPNGSGIYGTPSIRDNNTVYVADTSGLVYAYDVSNNGNLIWAAPISVNDTNLSSIAVGADYHIYLTSKNAFNVIDSSTGLLDWVFPIDPSGASVSATSNSIPTIDANNNVFFGTRANYLHCVNGAERIDRWKYYAGGAIQAAPVISKNNNIYVGVNDGYLYDLSGNGPAPPLSTPIVQMHMVDAQHTGVSPYRRPTITQTPSTYWSSPLSNSWKSGNLYVSPAFVIASNGTLYIGSNDGYVYAINPTNGNSIWKTRVNNTDRFPFTSPQSMYTTPAIATDGTIYIGSNEGLLYALTSTGVLKWAYNAGYPLQSSPIISATGIIYFGAGIQMFAIRDDIYRSYSVWLAPFSTTANICSSPALGQNGWLYFGSSDGIVYAVHAFTGIYQWSYNTGHPIYGSPTVDASNNVIVGNGSNTDGTLYYFDGINGGAPLWQNGYEAMIGPFYDTPAVSSDTIYLSTIAYVYAINRIDGSMKWKYYYTNYYYTSPIVDASGTIFFASLKARDDAETGWKQNDGILHSITDNGNSFTSNWTYNVSSKARLAPPVMGSDGTIYINATNNKMYAIK